MIFSNLMAKNEGFENMDSQLIPQNDDFYPPSLKKLLKENAPKTITIWGNPGILKSKPLALFCSVKCPGKLILKTYDLAKQLRNEGIAVIGGFHSPMERECLDILLRRKQPVIICPNRSIKGIRLPAGWKKSISDGRFLLLSPFGEKLRRGTVQTAHYRNQIIAALAEEIFITYAAPQSKTEEFCREMLDWGKKVCTFEANTSLIDLGVQPIRDLARF